MASENDEPREVSNPNSQSTCTVTRAMLPLHCPTQEMSLWNSHPRIFLPIEETGKARCPYCGTEFILENE